MRATPAFLRLSFVAAALVACNTDDDTYDDTRERGEIGRGRFVYACLADGDTACEKTDAPSLPQAVAVGGLFDVRFAIESGGAQPAVISPARDIVRPVSAGFRVEAEGSFPLLAVNGNREVIDIKHMRAAEITEVRVRAAASDLPSRSVTLDVGEKAELAALPYDAENVLLAGALDYTWTSDDEGVLEVVSVTDLQRVQVRARGNGSTSLRVQVAGTSFEVAVTVGDELDVDGGVEEDAGEADATVEDDAGEQPDAEPDADAETDGGVQ